MRQVSRKTTLRERPDTRGLALTLDTYPDLFEDDLEAVAVKLGAVRAATPISGEWASAIASRRA